MGKTALSGRARADHAAAAIESLHLAIEALARAKYHFSACDLHHLLITQTLAEASGGAAKAHALMKIVAARIPHAPLPEPQTTALRKTS